MELEEAVKNLNDYIFAIDNFGTIDPKCCNNLYEPAKVILKELDKKDKAIEYIKDKKNTRYYEIMTEEEKEAIFKIREIIEFDKKHRIETIYDKKTIDFRKNIELMLNLLEKLKKEIEEKTTIIFAGAEKVKSLQKENEELKEDNLGIREENIKLVNCHISYERYTGLDFLLPDKFKYAIPKDKIEKIKNKNIGQYMNFYREIEELLEEG